MGRKNVTSAEGVSNPLLKSFGVYLRLRRKVLGLSIQDMARSFGVTPTYYRLIEAGQSKVGIGWVSDIICIFESRKVYINFSSLAMLLTGIAILEKSWAFEIDLEDPFQELADYSDFKELLEDIRPYFSFEEGSKDLKNFLETKACNAMRNYLETGPGQRDRGCPHLALKDVSPEGVEILINLHRQLNGRRFLAE